MAHQRRQESQQAPARPVRCGIARHATGCMHLLMEHAVRGNLQEGQPCARAGAVGGRVTGLTDGALERLAAALQELPKLDAARAEWVARQLLEAGEHGLLSPLSVVLDAYVRGKARQDVHPPL